MDTAGIGSIIVLAVGLSVLAAYYYMLRWIRAAPPDAVLAEADSGDAQAKTTESGGEEA
jgi:hypothetical protein